MVKNCENNEYLNSYVPKENETLELSDVEIFVDTKKNKTTKRKKVNSDKSFFKGLVY